MIVRQFAAMFKARTMEFVRDRGTFFWNLLFPLFLVFGLAFAFSGGEEAIFKVGVVGTPRTDMPFMRLEQARFIPYQGADAAATASRKLEQHQIDMVIDFGTLEFAVNKESSKGRLIKTLFVAQQTAALPSGAGQTGALPAGAGSAATVSAAPPVFTEKTVSGRATRYVDWLVPGVIGMNMMFSSLFGVGYVLVRYRKNGVLKRFKATPVSALNFVSAQAASRLIIVLLTSIFVYIGTNLFLRFEMRGSYLNLLLLTTFGILCMISLGLVFASRMRSEEMAGGLLNIVTFPMLALSGVFFSLEGSPPILKTIAQFFPLTHFIDASRKIMIDGAGLPQIAPHLLVLGGLTAAFLALSAFLFKWE